MFTRVYFNVPSIQIDDPLGLSDHLMIELKVNWRLRVDQLNSVKSLYRKVNWKRALAHATALNCTLSDTQTIRSGSNLKL